MYRDIEGLLQVFGLVWEDGHTVQATPVNDPLHLSLYFSCQLYPEKPPVTFVANM
jgi:hypothetical protein